MMKNKILGLLVTALLGAVSLLVAEEKSDKKGDKRSSETE
jgi:hypothetical protein